MHSPALPCSKNVKHARLENDLNWTKSKTHTLRTQCGFSSCGCGTGKGHNIDGHFFFINFLLGRFNDKLLMQFIEFSTKLTK